MRGAGTVCGPAADRVEDWLILSVPSYALYDFALRDPAEANSSNAPDTANQRDRADIDYLLDQQYQQVIQSGIPVALGE